MENKNDTSPTLATQESFYDQYWQNLKPFGSYKLIRIIKIIGYLNKIRKTKRRLEIVDLGCGDGRSVAIWNTIGTASGFDLSPNAIQKAKVLFPYLPFFSGDALHSEFSNGRFDVVISQEVIEHIELQDSYLEECARILNIGGFLVLTTPNKYYFDRIKGGNYSRQPIENILSPTELKNLIKKRFEIIKLESVVVASADSGIYPLLCNRYFVSLLIKLKLEFLRKYLMEKVLLGVHTCVVARKKP